jgi:hypothetical protein
MKKIVLLAISVVLLATALAALPFIGLLPSFNPLVAHEETCLSRKFNYDNLVHVVDLPNEPKLRSAKGQYLDLYYAYRFMAKNTFVLSEPNWRCGKVIDVTSLRATLGSSRFESAFVAPPNPNSILPDVLKYCFIVLIVAAAIALMIYNGWVSENYSGKWLAGGHYVVDDPQKLQGDLKKKFGKRL